MAEEGFIELGLSVDDAGAAAEIEAILTRAFQGAAKEMSVLFDRALSGNQGTTRKFASGIRDIGEQATKSFGSATRSAEEFETTLRGLGTLAGRSRLDPQMFAGLQGAFREAREEIDRLKQELSGLTKSGGTKEQTAAVTQQLRSAINSQVVAVQTASRAINTAQTEQIEGARHAAAAERDQTRLAIAASKERIVAAQQEGSQTLAATRAAAAQRVAITRGVFQVIRGLEQGFDRLISGGSNILGKSVSGIGGVLSGLTNVIRRSDSQLATGLNTSLNKRESIMRSSFSDQERIVRTSLTRQARAMQQFNEVTSSGLSGLASGRSNAANALGIGGILGGGFLIFNQLKQGITAAQDFNQTMAVLQAQLQLTNEQMQAIRQTSVALGNDISLPGVSAKDAGDAIALLAKQFGSLGDQAAPAATAAAKGVLQLSRATQSTAEASSQVVGTAINVFKIQADQATAVADQVATALSKAAGTSFDDFAAAFNQAAAIFQAFQGPVLGSTDTLLEFNTALAALAKGGLVGSDAGTSLKNFFTQASRGAPEAEKALKGVLQRAGETGRIFFDAAGNARPFGESLDILRRGLEGLDDEARTNVLQKAFGTDAFRVAQILTSQTTAEFDNLRESLRRQGTAADIAAAQNQGLRGAMDALGSVVETLILQGFDKLDKPLGNFVTGIASLVNNVATAGGAFQVIRDGLKGVAAGLGALIAVKGAIEIIQLLGAAFGAVLTPVGLLITGVAAAGAAISIMSKRSEGFRDFLGSIREKAVELGTAGIDFLKEKAGQLADFFTGTVLPVLKRIADVLRANFVAGFQVASNFIRQTAIPAFQKFIDFLTGTVIPVVQDTLGKAFDTASGAVVGFWNTIRPVLQPAITGIGSLVSAIETLAKTNPGKALLSLGGIIAAAVGGFAVGGPAGAAIAGAGATVAAIFANGLQNNLGKALAGVGASIGRAFQNLMSKIDLGRIVGLAFEKTSLAQDVGRILGRVLSSPQLVTAVAGAAGFAALLAGRFIIGFAQGIQSNIGKLASLLGNALKIAFTEGIKFALDNPTIILGALSALFLARGFINLFRTAGQQAGSELQVGLIQSFRSKAFGGALAGGGPGGGFFNALIFGGAGIDRAVSNAEVAVRNGIARIKRQQVALLQTAGRLPDGIFTPTAQVTSEFNKLAQQIGPGGVVGLKLRAALKGNFAALGLTAGQAALAVGKSIAAGIAGGVAGFQLGKSLAGQSGKSQIASIGGLALSIGAISPPAGVAAGALGLLGVAMGNMAKKSQDAKQKLADLTDALKNAGKGAETEALAKTIFGELEKAVKPEDLQKILLTGFDLSSVIDQVTTQGRDVGEVMSSITNNKDFTDALHRAGVSGKEFLDFVTVLGGELRRLDDAQAGAGAFKAFNDQLKNTGPNARTAKSGLDLLLGPLRGVSNGGPVETTGHLNELLDEAKAKFEEAKAKADEFFGSGGQTNLTDALQKFTIDLPNLQARIDEITVPDIAPILKDALTGQLNQDIQVNLRGLLKVGLTSGQVQATPQGVQSFLAGLTEQVNNALAQGAITPEVAFAVQAQITALANSPDLMAQVAALVAQAPTSPATVNQPVNVNPQIDEAATAAALAAAVGAVISGGGGPQGLRGGFGSARSGASAATVNVPVSANIQVINSNAAEAGSQVAGEFAAAIAASAPAGGLAGAFVGLAAANGMLSQAGQAARAGVTISTIAAQAMASGIGLAAAGGIRLALAFAAGIQAGAGSAIGAARAMGAAASAAVSTSPGAAESAGRNLAAGLARGIQAGAGAAIAAARAMAAAVQAAAESALGISSPSTVFITIGHQIGDGLAQGIADAKDGLGGVVDDVMKGITDKAVDWLDVITGGVSDLFKLLQPSGTAGSTQGLGFIKAQVGVANLGTDLASIFQGSLDAFNDAVKQQKEDASKLTPEQRAILAQGVGKTASLAPDSVLGGRNIDAFVSLGQKLRDFIDESIKAGVPLPDIMAQVKAYRQQLFDVGGTYGATGAQLEFLLRSLGLLDPQLDEFIKQANDLAKAAGQTKEPTKPQDEKDKEIAALKEQLRRAPLDRNPTVNVNVYPPFGDPEAIGVGAANRVAAALGI